MFRSTEWNLKKILHVHFINQMEHRKKVEGLIRTTWSQKFANESSQLVFFANENVVNLWTLKY